MLSATMLIHRPTMYCLRCHCALDERHDAYCRVCGMPFDVDNPSSFLSIPAPDAPDAPDAPAGGRALVCGVLSWIMTVFALLACAIPMIGRQQIVLVVVILAMSMILAGTAAITGWHAHYDRCDGSATGYAAMLLGAGWGILMISAAIALMLQLAVLV